MSYLMNICTILCVILASYSGYFVYHKKYDGVAISWILIALILGLQGVGVI